jgi:23S rRNA pseudouridine1911/1915/1917 synthase
MIDGQALHAKSLGFMHPKSREWIYCEVELPTGFITILQKWESYIGEK